MYRLREDRYSGFRSGVRASVFQGRAHCCIEGVPAAMICTHGYRLVIVKFADGMRITFENRGTGEMGDCVAFARKVHPYSRVIEYSSEPMPYCSHPEQFNNARDQENYSRARFNANANRRVAFRHLIRSNAIEGIEGLGAYMHPVNHSWLSEREYGCPAWNKD